MTVSGEGLGFRHSKQGEDFRNRSVYVLVYSPGARPAPTPRPVARAGVVKPPSPASTSARRFATVQHEDPASSPDTGELADFRRFYATYLESHYPNDDAFADNSYTRLRDAWTLKSWEAAFQQKDENWDPLAGFAFNEARIRRLYDYYRDLFNSDESRFLWAGLGRMAGGAVLGGLGTLAKISGDPSFATNTMVLIGKEIFRDLAWQHELFRSNQQLTITTAQAHDQRLSRQSELRGRVDQHRVGRSHPHCGGKQDAARE